MNRLALALVLVSTLAAFVFAADEKPAWQEISAPILQRLAAENKIGYPGGTAGVAVDPASGEVYVVVCDQGIWKSSDKGATFERADDKKIGGRCETGYALNFDPLGKRLMCFMIYGGCALTLDGGKTWQSSKLNHLDFGAVDWSDPGAKNMAAIKHESGGELVTTSDAAQTWTSCGKGFKQVGIVVGGVLLAGKTEGIVRSADGGKTWNKVSDLIPSGYVMQVRGGTAYWATAGGVAVSKDQGQTWAVQGAPIKATLGPYFGKTEAYMLVANKDGIHESLDAGATWKLVAAMPPGFPPGPVGPNLAFDAQNNILYASTMGKPAYKLQR